MRKACMASRMEFEVLHHRLQRNLERVHLYIMRAYDTKQKDAPAFPMRPRRARLSVHSYLAPFEEAGFQVHWSLQITNNVG